MSLLLDSGWQYKRLASVQRPPQTIFLIETIKLEKKEEPRLFIVYPYYKDRQTIIPRRSSLHLMSFPLQPPGDQRLAPDTGNSKPSQGFAGIAKLRHPNCTRFILCRKGSRLPYKGFGFNPPFGLPGKYLRHQ